jgi:hypothetical protein
VTRSTIELTFIKVLNAFDENEDEEGSLKTGERAVTIIPIFVLP